MSLIYLDEYLVSNAQIAMKITVSIHATDNVIHQEYLRSSFDHENLGIFEYPLHIILKSGPA